MLRDLSIDALLWISGILLAILMLAGCGATQSTAPKESTQPVSQPNEESRFAEGDPNANAARLAAELDDALDGDGAAGDGGEIRWVDGRMLKSAPSPDGDDDKADARDDQASNDNTTNAAPKRETIERAAINANDDQATSIAANHESPRTVSSDAADAKPAPSPASLSRAELLAELHGRIADSDDPATIKALGLAGLALASPDHALSDDALGDLPPTQQQLVRRFHGLFASLGKQIAAGETINRDKVADQLNALIGEQPLSIRKAMLCRRVRGYGVYEEMPGDAFVAGREHPIVVYAELDHFKVQPADDHLYNHQVKLSQELVLYNESDGLAVWRQPAETIVDESRNRRRDFYTVQPTRLPARLTVGKYILKVRVRDHHGGTRDEVSVPINIVADPSLVKPLRRTTFK